VDALDQEKEPSLSNRNTSLDGFRRLFDYSLTLNILLKPEDGTESAANLFNPTLELAGWNAMP
jgi:hypothetical protein